MLAAWAAATAAGAQDNYPSQPIRLVVPFAAGGGNDLLARLIGQRLHERLGQPTLVDNRPGAGGNIGAEYVAKSLPDGHTLLLATNTVTMAPHVAARVPFDVQRDFEPIALLCTTPFALVVAPDLHLRSVAQLVAYAKANPGKLSYASTGIGTPHHLGMELFKGLTDTDMLHVPYKGSVPALTDVATGRAQLMFVTINAALPFIHGNKVRVLAVGERERITQLRDVPTAAEAGVSGFELSAWYAVLAPGRTPAGVVKRLAGELQQLFFEPETRARLQPAGYELTPGSPERLRALIAADLEKWGKVVREAGIKAQ